MAIEQAAGQVVGREEELLVLESFLDGVEGGGAALLLEGDAGIGKTTLWKQGVASAQERGMRVLACRPGGAEAQLSFAGLDDVLAEVVHEALPALPAPQQRALEVALLLEDPAGLAPDQRTIAVAFLGVLRHLALDAHVLLALDDAQWLDPPSAAAFEFAIRRLRDEPIGVLLSKRIESSGPVTLALEKALPEERLRRLSVGPLSLGALHQLVRARLGLSLPRPTLRRVQDISGGNPFFALELARALERRGGALSPGDDLPVPGNLQELVRERLDRLPPASREAVLAVAALAQPTEEQVEAALGAAAAQSLADAAAAGIIELEHDRIRFTHPLLASVVFAEASRRERAAIHRRLAEVVDDPEERAHHLALAATRASATVASSLDRAARNARARGAPDTAANLAEHALELTPASAVDDAYRRKLDAADHHFASGNPARAAVLLEQVIAAAEPGPARARARHRLAGIRVLTSGAAAARVIATGALDDVQGDDRVRAAIEVDLAFWTEMTDGLYAALPHAHAALELGERLGDKVFLVDALMGVVFFELALGHGLQHELLDRALKLEESLGEHGTELPPTVRPSLSLWELRLLEGDLEAARSNLEARLELVEQLDPKFWAGDLARLGGIELRAGNWERAAMLAEEAGQLADQFGLELLGHRTLAAHLRALGGDVERARSEAEQILARAAELGKRRNVVEARGILGFLELSLGNAAEAHAVLEPALRLQYAAGVGDPALLTSLPDEVEALVLLGRLEEAEAMLEPFEEGARRLDRPWALATAARCRGLLHAAQNELPRALETLEHAVALHERLPMPFERARTLLALGVTQRRAKQRRAARETLQAALTIFEDLGAALWAEKAHGEMGRIAGRAPSSGELTPTERRVAALAAEGRTNREVAAALYVSERTIEGNLSRVYSKLGVRSRTELAHLLAEAAAPAADL